MMTRHDKMVTTNRGRRGSDDDRGPLWDPKRVNRNLHTNGLQRRPGTHYRLRTESKRNLSQNESDRSNSGNRSNQSAQSKWSDQSHNRQTHYGQENPTRGRESSADQRERSRYNELMTRIAQLPSQIMRPFDYQCNSWMKDVAMLNSTDVGSTIF